MVEGQVAVQFGQAQESNPLEPGVGQPSAQSQVVVRGRPLVDLEHARVDLLQAPLARMLPDPQVQPPKVSALIHGVG